MDCIWENLKNVGPPFFQIYGMSVNTQLYQNFITQLENHSQLLCGHDFASLQSRRDFFVRALRS